jgi:hypothetical protein
MLGWVLGAVAVLLVAIFVWGVWSRTRMYRRLFSDRHFLELAGAAVALQQAGLDRPITDSDQIKSQSDPRCLLTSAGLAVVYTVSTNDSEITHHCSVSLAAGPTARAVGEIFLLLMTKLLGLPIDKLRVHIGSSTVHHALAILTLSEHARLASAPAFELTADNLEHVRREIHDLRANPEWRAAALRSGGG